MLENSTDAKASYALWVSQENKHWGRGSTVVTYSTAGWNEDKGTLGGAFMGKWEDGLTSDHVCTDVALTHKGSSTLLREHKGVSSSLLVHQHPPSQRQLHHSFFSLVMALGHTCAHILPRAMRPSSTKPYCAIQSHPSCLPEEPWSTQI